MNTPAQSEGDVNSSPRRTAWQREHLDAPLRGPGLQWLARRLAGPSPTGDPTGCERALNLDGGPSTGFRLAGSTGHEPLGPTPWLLTASAR